MVEITKGELSFSLKCLTGESMKTIIKSDIVSALKSVGLQNGDSVMVHT